jgi:hypothetical protein
MKGAVWYLERGYIPVWLYAAIHFTLWAIGFTLLVLLQPLILLADRRESRSRQGLENETMTKGQVVV